MTVSDAGLERIGADQPTLWQVVSELVYAQLDASVHGLAQILALPPRARIAARLMLFADVVPLTQAHLGELCGLSRKSTSAHLTALEAAGAITRSYAAIRLVDRAVLTSIIDAV